MADTAEQEPSMEEILASIRRIISEDDDEPADLPPEPEPERRRGREREEMLDVTERAREPVRDREPPREPVRESARKPSREPEPAVEDDIAFEEPEIIPAGLEAPAAADDDLVSEPVANAAASAFGDLVGQMLVSSRSTEGKTLEDIVRELVKPMLREWLDANLRGIVEAAVAQEVARISARGRR